MLYFSSPNEIPLEAITTLGISAKPDPATAIGFFGTGLKYAIAIILRSGGQIKISRQGKSTLTFGTREIEVRGKPFSLITIRDDGDPPKDLGFTTELGKTWPIWHAYRELYANTLDEGGKIISDNMPPPYLFPRTAETIITVNCPQLDQVHQFRDKYILSDERLCIVRTNHLEILPGASSALFYRGFRVNQLPAPSSYTYNLLTKCELTEDRLLGSPYVLDYWAQDAIANSSNSGLIRQVILAAEGSYEDRLCFSVVGSTFLDVLSSMRSDHRLPHKFLKLLQQHRPISDLRVPTAAEQAAIDRAKAILDKAPILADSSPIHISNTPRGEVMGEATDGKIILYPRAFDDGDKSLAGTIFEEQVHLTFGYADCSRDMQNFLLRQLINLLSKS
jgi:hypothetical protein